MYGTENKLSTDELIITINPPAETNSLNIPEYETLKKSELIASIPLYRYIKTANTRWDILHASRQ